MRFETLKSGRRKKYFIGVVVFVAILSTLVLNTSLAKYQTSQRIKLAEGKINYVPYDFKIMAMYQQNSAGSYDEIETMPSKGYTINEEKSYCTLDNKVHDSNAKVFTNELGQHVMENLSKKDKCYIWFDEVKILAKDQILAQVPMRTETPNFANTSCASGCEETTNGLYKSIDNDGETYYFRGTIDNNWVKFAGFYWRIVRINGDNTIRIIYNGYDINQNGESTQVGKDSFNSSQNDNMHVGYMYESGKVQGLANPSTIKGVLESWYDTNIFDRGFDGYVDVNAGFCGDRTAYTNTTGSTPGEGTGTATTYYGAYIRLITNKTPTLKCNTGNSSPDLYTKAGANKGNKALTQPVGLITADEVAFAGGAYGTANDKYYLYTGQEYWTMTPSRFLDISPIAYVFIIRNSGRIEGNSFPGTNVYTSNGIRPVINLRADTQFKSGNGTSSSPFEV